MMGATAVKPKVMVVEDELVLRMLAAETLRDAGFDVRDAHSGDSALEMLRDAPVDLLISDIKMPGRSGYQLAEAAMELYPELKIVLMTGYTQEPLPAKIANAGIQMMHKPFNIDRLVELAHKLLA